MEFKAAYNFPLACHYSKVFTSEPVGMAFDFATQYSGSPYFRIGQEVRNRIVEMINGREGTVRVKTAINLTYKDGVIYANNDGVKREFIIMRGWGYLTGRLSLEPDYAAKLQDDFAKFIIDTLNKYIVIDAQQDN